MTKNARLGSDPLSWIMDTKGDKDQNNIQAPDIRHIPESEKENKISGDTEMRNESVSISRREDVTEEIDPIHVTEDALTDEHVPDKKDAHIKEDKHYTGGKFLTFFLAGEEYGIEIVKVLEIIGLMKITAIPRMPKFIKGVINLRGQIIPVMDLRSRFSMPKSEENEENVIILVQAKGSKMGIVVDSVSEVLDIDNEHIQDRPNFGSKVNTDYILALGKSKGKVMILLDIEKVVYSKELGKIPAAKTPQPKMK